MDRVTAGGALTGLGLLLVSFSVYAGGLSPGYGIGIAMVSLRVGAVFAVLGIATIVLRSFSVVYAVAVSSLALIVLFSVGVATMYHDLALTPPGYGTPLTTSLLVINQVEITLALAPVPVGFAAGVFAIQDRQPVGIGALLGTAIVGWIGSSQLMLARGSAPGFTESITLFLAMGAVGAALIPFHLVGSLPEKGQ